MKNGKKQRATAEEFVRAWQACESAEDVAKMLNDGRSARTLCTTAGFYRKRGVRLKKFNRGRERLDVDALNKICG
jgi:hypothetical protein